MKKEDMIVVMSAFHRRADLIADQLSNYYSHHGPAAFHILHPSIQSRDGVLKDLSERLEEFPGRVLINNDSYPTSYATIMGAFLSNTQLLAKDHLRSVQFVYIHTDGDLLVREGFADRITSSVSAFTAHAMSDSWFWYAAMKADQRFAKIRELLKISEADIIHGRQEGAFFPIDVWVEAAGIIERFYDRKFFEDARVHWPIEECVLPTIVRALYPELQPNRILVRTKECVSHPPDTNPRDVAENCVNMDDVRHMRADTGEKCLAIKWFSQRYDDDARRLVRSFLPSRIPASSTR